MAARNKRFIDQASASALVRYGPELSVLKELMTSSGAAYRQKINSAQAGAAGIRAAAAAAVPQLQGLYAGSAREGIPGLSGTQAINDMVSRGVRATESAAGSRRTALTELAADRAKITGRRSDIAQEIGAFTASEAGRLGDAAAQRSLTNRISLRSDATRRSEGAANRQNARDVARIRNAGKQPSRSKSAADAFERKYGTKPLSREQHNAQRSKVDSTGALIKDQIAKGSDRNRIASLLTNGRAAIKGTASDGTQVTLPAIPKTDPLVASAALDMAFDGHISDKNANELHRRGYSVKALGLPGSTERARRDRENRRRQTRRQANALANAFGPFGSTA